MAVLSSTGQDNWTIENSCPGHVHALHNGEWYECWKMLTGCKGFVHRHKDSKTWSRKWLNIFLEVWLLNSPKFPLGCKWCLCFIICQGKCTPSHLSWAPPWSLRDWHQIWPFPRCRWPVHTGCQMGRSRFTFKDISQEAHVSHQSKFCFYHLILWLKIGHFIVST